MNEHDLDARLRAKYRSRSATTAPPTLARRVLAIPATSPHRRGWLPRPSFGGSRLMFSATKTLAAAAIFATTGFFLMGVTSEPPDAAPAASTEFTQPDLEASYVSGSVIALEEPVFEGGQPTNIGPYLFEWTTEPTAVRWESSDPRLQGTGTTIEHGLQQTQRYAGIRSERWALENDEGAWVGSGDSYSSPAGGRGFVVLRGTGAYDGLTAYVAMDHDGPDEETMALFEGIVLPEPPPSLPAE